MFCVAKFFLILCTITLIKAIGLKIDGLLNLGDSWSYEYRILRSDANDSPHLRAEENPQDKDDFIAHQKDEEIVNQKDLQAIFDKEKEIAYQRDKETASNIEKMIAQQKEEELAQQREEELAQQRDQELAHHEDKIARQNMVKSAAQIQEEEDHLRLAEEVLRKEAKRLRTEAQNAKKDQRAGPIKDYQLHYMYNTNAPKTATDSFNSDENKDSDGQHNTNKKSKKALRSAEDSSDTPDSSASRVTPDSSESRVIADSSEPRDTSTSNHDSAENSISIANYTTQKSAKEQKHKKLKDVNETLLHENKTEKSKMPTKVTTVTTKMPTKGTTVTTRMPTKSTTVTTRMPTKVTTVRTGDIFTNAHQVKDDKKIMEFTNHLYKQTIKIFVTIKEKTNQDHLKNQIDSLAKSYQDKFKEFIKDTSGQKIKTRLGTQKVILNAIDTSFRLLKRLLNFLINSLSKKGTLRHNSGTVNRFQKAIETEKKLQASRACKKFAICRMGPGFSEFLADIMTILLKCDDKKFKQSMDAFTEVVKDFQYDDLLDSDTEKILKVVINRIEKENVLMLRAMVMVLKNTINSQNKPMIVNNYAARSNVVNSTLALLEIVDLLDTQIPRNETNFLEWTDMKKSLDEFATGKRHDVQDIMELLFKHVMTNLKALDKASKKIVSRNLAMILSLVVDKY